MLFFPDLKTAIAQAEQKINALPMHGYILKLYPHSNSIVATGRNCLTKALLFTIDKLTISPDDLFMNSNDMQSFSFVNGYTEAYYITYWNINK